MNRNEKVEKCVLLFIRSTFDHVRDFKDRNSKLAQLFTCIFKDASVQALNISPNVGLGIWNNKLSLLAVQKVQEYFVLSIYSHTSHNVFLPQVLGPLAGNTLFTEDDFKLLENFDMDLYARKVRNQVCIWRKLMIVIILDSNPEPHF